MDKQDMINMYKHTLEYLLLSHNKEWNNAIYSNLDGHGDYYTKRTKSENDKYHIIYMWNKKYDKNELVYETVVALGEGELGMDGLRVWD